MASTHSLTLAALLIGAIIVSAPTASFAAKGDCGQPSSNGDKPTVNDALTILRSSVGQPTDCDAKPCICDLNGDGPITATDALFLLRIAVGLPGTPHCNCPQPGGPGCTSATITTRSGSDLDSGWKGLAHNSELVEGASITIHTLRRCSVTTATTCKKNADCPPGETCKATCDCDTDKLCDVDGPIGKKKCLNTLADCTKNTCHSGTNAGVTCASNGDCTGGGTCTGAECGTGDVCLPIFGTPLPLVTNGTPVCVVTFFDTAITGTADSGTGEAVISAQLRSRIFTGKIPVQGEIGGPCPRCGLPEDNPQVGDTFACDGGQFPLAACTVEAISHTYGGLSSDCPPSLGGNVSGTGLIIRFDKVTTGVTTKTAQLPCRAFGNRGTPTLPTNTCAFGTKHGQACTVDLDCSCGSNVDCVGGNGCNKPTCIDTKTACSSNADCKRCTLDTSIVCSSGSDCTGNGSCAEAPDQPATCGYWCNCGFCNNNPSLPCFDTTECPAGQTCQIGAGVLPAANVAQAQANDCSKDKFVCGQFETERCATTETGSCTLKPYLPACDANSDCSISGGGVCDIQGRPCFESRITRNGTPSPLGKYCQIAATACTTNADCGGAGDTCISDSSVAATVALFCVPASSSDTVNKAGGITGPGAVTLQGFTKVCRCGDTIKECDEQCDDGNTVNGDGCDDFCQTE